MPDDIKPQSLIEEVEWLRNDSIQSLVRRDMEKRWHLINLDHDAEMAEHETRGGPVYTVNSPRVLELKRTLQATMATYEIDTEVVPWIPQGGDTEKFKRQAQSVEPFYVLSRAKLDNGGRVSHKIRGHLLGSSYVVVIMDFEAAGVSSFPFSLRVPPPNTVYFPEQSDYPCVPPIMGMSYEMLVRDIIAQYSDQTRTEFAGKKLYLGKSTGKFDWHGIGAEHAVDAWDGTGSLTMGFNGRYQKATIKVLYADGWCYHVAMDVGGNNNDKGQIIWKYPSMTGGVPAFIMSGNVGETMGRKHLLPGLYAPIQTTNIRNTINTVRLTRSRNLKPDVFMEWPPEVWESVKEQGWVREASQAEIEAGGPHIMQGPGGVPHFWQVPKDEDLKELEASIIAEEHEYIQQIQAITNHETAERATAQGLRLVEGNVEDQHTEWLNSLAMMWTEMHYFQEIAMTGHDPRLWVDADTEQKMLIAKPGKPYLDSGDLKEAKESMNLYASKGMKYSAGELVAGKSYTITEESLNFGHEIRTTISSQTAAKKREALEDAVRRRDVYGAPVDEILETQGYPDLRAVKRSMAKEEAYGAAGQGMMGIPVLALDKALQLSGGVNIAALKGILAPLPLPAPGGPPDSTGPQQDPATQGAGGTSAVGGQG